MGFEPGGRADKLGNRFEGLWTVKQLLRVFKEEIRAVMVEAIGDEAEGADLWVEHLNGQQEAHQCKAGNKSKESWTVGDLGSRGVLRKAYSQLRRGAFEFVFVSGVPATLFEGICNTARNSPEDPEVFYHYHISSGGRDRQQALGTFWSALSLAPDKKEDLANGIDFLRRFRTVLYPFDENTRKDLLTWIGFLLDGDPEAVLEILLNYAVAQERLGAWIHAEELLRYLENHGFRAKSLVRDRRLWTNIERLQTEFVESVQPYLICGEVIPRQETTKCLDAISSGNLVILHGSAGSGKSGVLFELIRRFQEENTPWLALRLDRRIPGGTAMRFGQEMGLLDSPVNSLVAAAGQRPCVLVLDQLDAIRWSCIHSATALEVCKEMARQVRGLQSEARISIVIACRTFDLESDPEIRSWLKGQPGQKWTEIRVGPLSEDHVRLVVGDGFGALSQLQRDVLSNPNHLAIWGELSKSGSLPAFRTGSELIGRFLKDRRRKLEELGVVDAETIRVFDCVLEWAERNGTVFVPEHAVDACSPRAVKACLSLGILQEQGGRISFSHQSYLDFLIARRLLKEVDDERSILHWLGSKERQTLIRRQQLRQALAMLSDERPHVFLACMKEILEAENVRFHIKHLVLEVVGQIHRVPANLGQYCLELLDGPKWTEAMVETVFVGHPAFVSLLIQNGHIADWLSSENEPLIQRAVWMMRTVADKLPESIVELLKPYAECEGEWPARILNTIWHNVNDDSDCVFEMRVSLARRGVLSNMIDWGAVCRDRPLRVFRLVEAVLSSCNGAEEEQLSRRLGTLFEHWGPKDSAAAKRAAEVCPVETWEWLLPHLVRLSSSMLSWRERRAMEWWMELGPYSKAAEAIRHIVEMLVAAGAQMAMSDTEQFLARTRSIENSPHRVTQEVLLRSYKSLPAKHADHGIRWLLGDASRLRLGHGLNEPVWAPAAHLLEALSPHCSDAVFAELEQFLARYHAPNEIDHAKRCFEIRQHGYYRNHYWGEAQYFLLRAICPNRLSPSSRHLVRVLERRFDDSSEDYFLAGGRVRGGTVGSKLDKNLERISDSAWLRIISSRKVPAERMAGEWVQIDENHVVESSVGQFSNSLRRIAKRYPERFGQLSLRFPTDTHPSYIAAICDALATTHTDSEVAKEITESGWEPASPCTVLAVWEKFRASKSEEFARSICWMIRKRPLEKWPESAIERLVSYATTHPDPGSGELHVHCDKSSDDATVDILSQNMLRCVRGLAAHAMAALLWEHTDIMDRIKPGIESLVSDPHPVVRIAAIDLVLASYNIDPDQAVRWFCQLCEGDVRVTASPNAVRFFNYAIKPYADRLAPLVLRMVNSEREDVVKMGAQLVTAYHVFHGLFSDEMEVCLVGSMAQRKGVAETAAQLVDEPEYAGRCRELLLILLNDSDSQVRTEIGDMFSGQFFGIKANLALAEQFAGSKALGDAPVGLVHTLAELKSPLVPLSRIIFRIVQTFSTGVLDQAHNSNSQLDYVMHYLSPLLLRLYDQALEQDEKIAGQCLDAWDSLFERRVGLVRKLTQDIDM